MEFSLRLSDLLSRERGGMAEFLVAAAEFDGRCLYEPLGYTSLFTYLHRELGLSKAAAYFRKVAVELVRRYPELIEPLRDGRLCMTAIVELAKVITAENRGDVVPQFFHRSKSEARQLAAALSPSADPPLRDVVTPLSRGGMVRPGEPVSTALRPETAAGSTLDRDVTRALELERDAALGYDPAAALARALSPTVAVAPLPTRCEARGADPPPDEVEPLTAALARLHVTVSRRFLDKLEAARNARSHAQPGARLADILEAGLDRLIADDARRKGLAKRPRAAPAPCRSGAIPAHVKRAVWKRDRGCCQWRLPNGEICGSRTRIQLDHIRPRALGGESTVENVRLLCGPHNRLAARQVLGDALLDAVRPLRPKQLARHPTGVGPGGG